MKKFLFLVLLAFYLEGCSFPTELFFEPPPVVVNPGESPSPPPTPTYTVMPTDSPAPPTPIPCAYAWANKTLADETAMVQDALKRASLSTVEVTVMAYGENCIDTIHNQVIRFTEMETDFYFTIPVKDSQNLTEMGNWVGKILPVVGAFPPGKVPGPNLGYCQFNFQDGAASNTIWVKIELAKRALDNGLSGEALYRALTAP